MNGQYLTNTVFQVMTEQPDTCHQCGSRLTLLEVIGTGDERVFVCKCNACQRIIPVLEDDRMELGN